MKYFALALTLLALAGCSTPQVTTTGPLYSYRADMTGKIGNYVWLGVGVTQLAPTNTIQLWSPVALDRLQITSCARQDVFQGVDSPYAYAYNPVSAELNGNCPIYFEAYSRAQLTSWAFLAFKGDETLTAKMECNGKVQTTAGMSVCQTKNGLEQTLTFPVKIAGFEADASCHMKTVDNLIFKMEPDKGFCRASFAAVDAQKNRSWHRLILIGYDSVLIR